MQAKVAVVESFADPLLAPVLAARPPLPCWLALIDNLIITLLNIGLMIEVVLVFANTLLRTLFDSSVLMGIDETSYLYLVVMAFLGGAVSYGRGEFIAIMMVVDKFPPAWRALF